MIRKILRSTIRLFGLNSVHNASQRVARGVYVDAIHLFCKRDGGEHELLLKYHLVAQDPTDTKPLVLDCSLVDAKLVSIESDVVDSQVKLPTGDGGSLRALTLKPGRNWANAELSVRMQWDGQNCLCIPDALPEIKIFSDDQRISGVRQAQVYIDSLPESIDVGCIDWSTDQIGLSNNSFIRLVLIKKIVHGCRSESVSPIRTVLSSVPGRAEDCVELGERIKELHAYLAQSFQRPTSGKVAFVTSELFSAPLTQGAVFLLPVQTTPGMLSDQELLSLLSAFWWDGGCRIVGGERFSLQLRTGISKGIALHWLAAHNHRAFEEKYLSYTRVMQKHANIPLADSSIAWVSIALGCYRGIYDNEYRRKQLCDVLAKYWGKYIHVETLLNELDFLKEGQRQIS